jgi:hypothetical protein
MTATQAGAVSRPIVNWNAIDWQSVHKTVRLSLPPKLVPKQVGLFNEYK